MKSIVESGEILIIELKLISYLLDLTEDNYAILSMSLEE